MKIARQFGTNWFTTVMGVGIVSALTYTSPVPIPFAHRVGEILFVLLNLAFATALVLWIARWVFHTDEAVNDFRHPGRALFYGALAMAVNVVGNDYLFVGVHMLPATLAVTLAKGIWIAGTILSLFSVIVIPYLLFVKHEVTRQETLASWLIPVVPPIVAAATGVNLLPFWGTSETQFAMMTLDIAMFGMTFFLFLMVSALVYSRLVYHGRLSGESVPSLWVEIGPIGMSMATLSTLPLKTTAILGSNTATTLHMIGLLFSTAMWGVGLWWIILSSMHSLMHLGRRGDGIPFNLGWWSYVFPIGSFTTGTYALGHLTHYAFFAVAGVVQLIILWGFFLVVAVRTARHTWKGTLFAWRAQHRTEQPILLGVTATTAVRH